MLTLPFAVIAVVSLPIAAFAVRSGAAEDRGMMPPSFVVDFTALLLLGGDAALVIAALGVVTRWAVKDHTRPLLRTLVNGLAVLSGTEAAWLAYRAAGGAAPPFTWPWEAVPIAAALAAYVLVKTVCANVLAPLVERRQIGDGFLANIGRNLPIDVVGATIAVGLVEIVSAQSWPLLALAAVPLYGAYRAYAHDVSSFEHASRRRAVVDALSQGVCAIDKAGRVTMWDEALERITDCPSARALRRPLAAALPAIAQTAAPKAIEEAMSSGKAHTLPSVTFGSVGRSRLLEIRIVPAVDGATIVWQDVTERVQSEQALKRNEERLALAAEGANDGLWEWDLRTKAFYASPRWKALVGLDAAAPLDRADDWLGRIHPEDIESLNTALKAHVAAAVGVFEHLHRIRHEDGSYRRVLCRGVVARGANQKVARIAGSLTDRTEQIEAEEQLRSVPIDESVAGLLTRTEFVERLNARLEEYKSRGGDRFAAMYFNLDRFKVVNDSLGHVVGDELLAAVTERLQSCLRQGDVLGRLGGDEFAILLNAIGDPQQANAIAFRIQKALGEPFTVDGREVFASASIGIAFGTREYATADEIMRDADSAMHHAKKRGKACHELFDAETHARGRDRLGLENDLRHAVQWNAFEMHYQPIVLLSSRRCVGFESLIRWKRNGEMVSPATFIPLAEELGLIDSVGAWTLQQACAMFAEWKRRYPNGTLEYITVNVSGRQLMTRQFLKLVEQTVEAHRLKPSDVRLEITETALVESPAAAAKLLAELREFGVKIYLDDFGTGYSSLSHLHKLPVDALKIDRSFVNSLTLPDRPAIVESILALARTLNTSVVAEGIERDEQASELVRLGCTHAQGYLFSRPLPAQAADALLAADQPLGVKPPKTEATRIAV